MKSAISFVLKKAGYEQLGVLWGYFRASGWRKSILTKSAVDAAGNPLPWYSYPFIHFIGSKLDEYKQRNNDRALRVFEFGSGNSTLWWANIAAEVVSVEDNKAWHGYVAGNKPENVIYKFAPDEDSYIGALMNEQELFDVIVIDGSFREACIREASSRLNPFGVMIVDNSDRESLDESLSSLAKQGFKQLEFYGIGPINGHPWSTSLYYRANNFLSI